MSAAADPGNLPTADAADDRGLGSALCTRCGLCCTGLLHNAAVLEPDEVASAAALGLPVRDSERPSFALPCPKLVDSCCSIYGNRPRVCGSYRCQLLQNLEAGETDFKAAVGKVAAARQLVEQAQAYMPPGMALPQVRILSTEPPPSGLADMDVAVRDREMRLRLAATALTLYIDRHFRNSRDGQMLELNPIKDPAEVKTA